MPPEKNNITVLIAPLDWGLGHATRCIPIIRILVKNSCRVLIATNGHHKVLLQTEFPDLEFLELPGYGIRYGKVNVLLRLVLQLPLFFRNVRRENEWLKQATGEYHIDAVISDNRYGLHSTEVPCVFMTHQLQVQSPAPFKWTENGVRKRLYRFIKKFDTCWVPDVKDKINSLGNALSHPANLPAIPVRYVGWLTRFLPLPVQAKKYKLLISLSGPEPQRTVLEELVIPQLKEVEGNVLLVRGLPGNEAIGTALSPALLPSNNVAFIHHLPGVELQKAIAETEFFMSRCGYSTLMDLQAVTCRCIFVPTPGQTEQEYLGRQIAASGKAVVVPQKNINLIQALDAAATLPHFSDGGYQNYELETIITDWINSLCIT